MNRENFEKLLMCEDPVKAIKDLHQQGLLSQISIELEEAWEFDQCTKYHSMNLTDHIFSVLDIVSKSKYGNDLRLRLAALFHDISKYKDYTFDGTTKHFKGHERSSANLAEKILIRLGYEKSVISDVKILISNHMRLKQNYDVRGKIYVGSNKTIRKFYRVLGDLAELELELIEADNLSHAPEYCMPGQVESIRDKWEILSSTTQPSITIEHHDIVNILGIKDENSIEDVKIKLQDILDEFPTNKSDLLLNYKTQYENKIIYVVKQDNKIFASLVDVGYNRTNNSWFIKSLDNAYELLEIKEDIRFDNLSVGKNIIQAIEYPLLYDYLEKDHKTRVIIDNISSELIKLKHLDNFRKAKITLRTGVAASIDWLDGTTTEIL